MNKYIIGIDIGTSGTKAVAYSHGGEVLASSYMAYEPIDTAPGRHELDPDTLFRAFLTVTGDILETLKAKATITAISLSAAMHSLVLMDGNDEPLTNLLTWADLRSKKQALDLRASEEGQGIYRNTGTPIHPMSPLCKIIWFRENMNDLFLEAAKFISIKEYIIFKLLRKYIVDYSIASATGLFDIYKLRWYAPSLLAAGITANKLSEPVDTIHIEKHIENNYPELRDLPAGLPIVLGASDGCLANLGTNAVDYGDVSLTIGTSGAVRMVTQKPQHDPQSRIFNYLLTRDLYVSGGPINNGGGLLKWYAENFLVKSSGEVVDFDRFLETAMEAPAGSLGLIFLPYVQGERSPVWDADAKGIFFGIHSEHTQSHFMRAIIEGICFSLLDVTSSLEETMGRIRNIFASGGFIRSPKWVQLLADILGKKISVTDTADASSIGAAMLAMYATGLLSDLSLTGKFLTIQETYVPDLRLHEHYKRNYRIYSGLYGKLKDDFYSVTDI
jgi:gluconokinase